MLSHHIAFHHAVHAHDKSCKNCLQAMPFEKHGLASIHQQGHPTCAFHNKPQACQPWMLRPSWLVSKSKAGWKVPLTQVHDYQRSKIEGQAHRDDEGHCFKLDLTAI